jgi:predicted nucleic acid-binding protein
MKYVLDASVALKWVLPEVDSEAALALREEFREGLCDLLSPDLLPAEIDHALARAERRGGIHRPDAREALGVRSGLASGCTHRADANVGLWSRGDFAPTDLADAVALVE